MTSVEIAARDMDVDTDGTGDYGESLQVPEIGPAGGAVVRRGLESGEGAVEEEGNDSLSSCSDDSDGGGSSSSGR